MPNRDTKQCCISNICYYAPHTNGESMVKFVFINSALTLSPVIATSVCQKRMDIQLFRTNVSGADLLYALSFLPQTDVELIPVVRFGCFVTTAK